MLSGGEASREFLNPGVFPLLFSRALVTPDCPPPCSRAVCLLVVGLEEVGFIYTLPKAWGLQVACAVGALAGPEKIAEHQAVLVPMYSKLPQAPDSPSPCGSGFGDTVRCKARLRTLLVNLFYLLGGLVFVQMHSVAEAG